MHDPEEHAVRPAPQELASLSVGRRVGLGVGMMVLGCALLLLMVRHPEGLRAPLWVAGIAVGSFVVAGIAVALHPFVSARVYAWGMVVLLSMLAVIPAWIAFGPGARVCQASLPVLAQSTGCRAAFGVSTIVMGLIVGVAVRQASRTRT